MALKIKISYGEVLPDNLSQLSQTENIKKSLPLNSVANVADIFKNKNYSQNSIEQNLPPESVAIVADENIKKNLLLNSVANVAKTKCDNCDRFPYIIPLYYFPRARDEKGYVYMGMRRNCRNVANEADAKTASIALKWVKNVSQAWPGWGKRRSRKIALDLIRCFLSTGNRANLELLKSFYHDDWKNKPWDALPPDLPMEPGESRESWSARCDMAWNRLTF